MLPLMLAGAMVLGGSVGKKADAFHQARVYGSEARGRIYEEAVRVFRTHADDKGWWQGEYWGKTMLSSAAVAEYADDAGLKDWLREKARAFVKEFQRPDGYLGTYSDPYFVGGPVPGQPRNTSEIAIVRRKDALAASAAIRRASTKTSTRS